MYRQRIYLQDNKFSLLRYLVLPTYHFKTAKYWSRGRNKISYSQWIILKFSDEFLQWQCSRLDSNFQVVSSRNEWEFLCGVYFKISALLVVHGLQWSSGTQLNWTQLHELLPKLWLAWAIAKGKLYMIYIVQSKYYDIFMYCIIFPSCRHLVNPNQFLPLKQIFKSF
jgi:hypothetical protein